MHERMTDTSALHTVHEFISSILLEEFTLILIEFAGDRCIDRPFHCLNELWDSVSFKIFNDLPQNACQIG